MPIAQDPLEATGQRRLVAPRHPAEGGIQQLLGLRPLEHIVEENVGRLDLALRSGLFAPLQPCRGLPDRGGSGGMVELVAQHRAHQTGQRARRFLVRIFPFGLQRGQARLGRPVEVVGLLEGPHQLHHARQRQFRHVVAVQIGNIIAQLIPFSRLQDDGRRHRNLVGRRQRLPGQFHRQRHRVQTGTQKDVLRFGYQAFLAIAKVPFYLSLGHQSSRRGVSKLDADEGVIALGQRHIADHEDHEIRQVAPGTAGQGGGRQPNDLVPVEGA